MGSEIFKLQNTLASSIFNRFQYRFHISYTSSTTSSCSDYVTIGFHGDEIIDAKDKTFEALWRPNG